MAVVGADFTERRKTAKKLADKHGLPLIGGCFDNIDFNSKEKGDGVLQLQKALDMQIRKQILYRKGFVSNGCSLDYIVLYKICMNYAEQKIDIPEMLRARLHAWRQLEKIVYVPLNKHDPLLEKYDAYLASEIALLQKSRNVPVEMVQNIEKKERDGQHAKDLCIRGERSVCV